MTIVRRLPKFVVRCPLLLVVVFAAPPARAQDAGASGVIDVGPTGFGVKRPVLASACEHGCPWGELGDFVKEAMQPFGYEVILCRNCNADKGPPLVSQAAIPPPIGAADAFVGTTTTVNAPVDFGITESGFLAWGYHGQYNYMQNGPFQNLRLIAKIEDPTYLLAAVKADSGITDLAQVAAQKMKVTILGGGSPISQPVLDSYGLTQDAVTSWGGTFSNPLIAGQADDPPFDIVINELASPANNPESAFWTKISQKHALRFLDMPVAVLDQLAADKTLGLTRVTVKWGFLRGVDRAISTVARSGHAVFGRDDMPEIDAYNAAKAIDQHRDALKWYIRPYSYESRTVSANFDVPLHPGAERYYLEVGYLSGEAGTRAGDAATQVCEAGPPMALSPGGGCAVASAAARPKRTVPVAALLPLIAGICRRRFRTRR
jgi:TRAP-type uncharacterized transport system substrate-binding protein